MKEFNRMLTFYPSQITDQGVKKAPNLDPQHWTTASFKKSNQCGGSRIRDVYPGSRIRLFSIPDPNCLHPGSSSKNLSILTHKKAKKWFLSSKKYDPGCSSRIPDPDYDCLPIPDPGSRGQKGTRSRIRIRNTGCHGSRNNHFLGIQPADDW